MKQRKIVESTIIISARPSPYWHYGPRVRKRGFLGPDASSPFAEVLDLFNRKFSGNGAFLLKGGYGIRPQQSAGQIFMKYGYEIEFHPKVDLTRIAWHQRG